MAIEIEASGFITCQMAPQSSIGDILRNKKNIAGCVGIILFSDYAMTNDANQIAVAKLRDNVHVLNKART